jgi:hypothetical protein
VVLNMHGNLEAFRVFEGLPAVDDALEVEQFPGCGFELRGALLA